MARTSSKTTKEAASGAPSSQDTPTAEEIAAIFASTEPQAVEATTLDSSSQKPSQSNDASFVNLEEQIVSSSPGKELINIPKTFSPTRHL